MGYPRPASIVAIAFTLFVQAEVAQCRQLYNGVYSGGVYQCFTPTADDSTTIAREACETLYGTGSCSTGACGYFQYYYPANTAYASCDCNTPVGVYQFIFANKGFSGVGQDYGGNMQSVDGNNLFTRVKEEAGCTANSWRLTLADLGAKWSDISLQPCGAPPPSPPPPSPPTLSPPPPSPPPPSPSPPPPSPPPPVVIDLGDDVTMPYSGDKLTTCFTVNKPTGNVVSLTLEYLGSDTSMDQTVTWENPEAAVSVCGFTPGSYSIKGTVKYSDHPDWLIEETITVLEASPPSPPPPSPPPPSPPPPPPPPSPSSPPPPLPPPPSPSPPPLTPSSPLRLTYTWVDYGNAVCYQVSQNQSSTNDPDEKEITQDEISTGTYVSIKPVSSLEDCKTRCENYQFGQCFGVEYVSAHKKCLVFTKMFTHYGSKRKNSGKYCSAYVSSTEEEFQMSKLNSKTIRGKESQEAGESQAHSQKRTTDFSLITAAGGLSAAGIVAFIVVRHRRVEKAAPVYNAVFATCEA